MAAPYHFAIDLLDRGANAETWAFIWMPLIIGALEDLSRTLEQTEKAGNHGNRNPIARLFWAPEAAPEVLKLGLGIAGLVVTHPLTAITFLPMAAGFACFRGWPVLRGFLAASAVALALTAVYWLPMVAYRPFTYDAKMGIFSGSRVEGTMFFPSLAWNEPLYRNDVYNRRLLYIFFGFILIWMIGNFSACNLGFDRRAGKNVIFFNLALGGIPAYLRLCCSFAVYPV
jgi:hypothetical protein